MRGTAPLIVFLLFVCLKTKGQALNTMQFTDGQQARFNASWIAEHGIKEIQGTVAFKRDDAPIQRTNEQYLYEFDEFGKTVKETHVYRLLNQMDTSEVHYRYDALGRLIKRIEKDAYGYFALNFFYNDRGQLVRRYHSRERKSTPLLDVFEREKIIWDDSIAYSALTDTVEQRLVHNSLGKAYQRVNTTFNDRGQVVREVETNLIGGQYSVVEAVYSTEGKMVVLNRTTTLRPGVEFSRRFEYNVSSGKLEFIRTLENGQLQSNRRLTYTKQGLIEFELTRYEVSRNMEIVSYTYHFFR